MATIITMYHLGEPVSLTLDDNTMALTILLRQIAEKLELLVREFGGKQ